MRVIKLIKILRQFALSVKIQSDNKTLQDTEINELSNKIISVVTEKFNAKQR